MERMKRKKGVADDVVGEAFQADVTMTEDDLPQGESMVDLDKLAPMPTVENVTANIADAVTSESIPEPKPTPVEVYLLKFKDDIAEVTNEYLKHGSAIFITDFIDALAADVHGIANKQIQDLAAKYADK